MKQPQPQYRFPNPMLSSSDSSFQFTGRTDIFAPFVFDPSPLRQEPKPVGATTKATGEKKPKATKEEKLEATRKEKPKPPVANITAGESLRQRQLERDGLVSRMYEALNDFGEELLDAHQAPEGTDDWYEEVDAMKQMYEFLQSILYKLNKLEPRKESRGGRSDLCDNGVYSWHGVNRASLLLAGGKDEFGVGLILEQVGGGWIYILLSRQTLSSSELIMLLLTKHPNCLRRNEPATRSPQPGAARNIALNMACIATLDGRLPGRHIAETSLPYQH